MIDAKMIDAKTARIDAEMADVIMGGLAVCKSGLTTGIAEGIEGTERLAFQDYDLAEQRVVEMLYDSFPEVVDRYYFLSVVKKIKRIKRHAEARVAIAKGDLSAEPERDFCTDSDILSWKPGAVESR